jgi:hypothetical protein
MMQSLVKCPGCGNEMTQTACRKAYDGLSCFTLELQDEYFHHQLIVDSYAAQHAGPGDKPVRLFFALVGLYLVNEKGYTGKQVQEMHVTLGKNHREWPRFEIPAEKNWLTVADADNSPNEQKKEMIKKWSQSVWNVWKGQSDTIRLWLA